MHNHKSIVISVMTYLLKTADQLTCHFSISKSSWSWNWSVKFDTSICKIYNANLLQAFCVCVLHRLIAHTKPGRGTFPWIRPGTTASGRSTIEVFVSLSDSSAEFDNGPINIKITVKKIYVCGICVSSFVMWWKMCLHEFNWD